MMFEYEDYGMEAEEFEKTLTPEEKKKVIEEYKNFFKEEEMNEN